MKGFGVFNYIKAVLLLGVVLFLAACGGTIREPVTPLEEGSVTSGTVEVRIDARTDDAEESNKGVVDLSSSDLELVVDGSAQTVGMRFAGVDVPAGAVVTSAYIQFKVEDTSSGSTALTLHGEATGNARTFESRERNISSRARTLASASWRPESWGSRGEAGAKQRSADLSNVVQEIVSRSDWQAGNALAFIVTGSGKRVAESYDGDAAGAPLLVVSYKLESKPIQADGTFAQTDAGLVELEAEAFHANTPQGEHAWKLADGTMHALPDSGTNHNTGYVATSPRLDFTIDFNRSGTHYVWVRGVAAGSDGGSRDSVHVGLNGKEQSGADRISGFGTSPSWQQATMDGPVARIEVPSAGVHTLNVWMREDGLAVDKLVLTPDSSFVPGEEVLAEETPVHPLSKNPSQPPSMRLRSWTQVLIPSSSSPRASHFPVPFPTTVCRMVVWPLPGAKCPARVR